MKRKRTIRARLGLGLALVAMLAGTAGIGVASGAIPSSSGKIYGCFAKSDGRLRAIDKAKQQKCTAAEQSLSWNQQGPKGDAGPQGLTGDAGPQGLNGQRGAQGPAGPSGTANLQRRGGNFTLAPRDRARVFGQCAPGELVVSGGYSVSTLDPGVIVTESDSLNGASAGRPGGGNELIGWQVVFINTTAQSQPVSVEALCSAA